MRPSPGTRVHPVDVDAVPFPFPFGRGEGTDIDDERLALRRIHPRLRAGFAGAENGRSADGERSGALQDDLPADVAAVRPR